MASNHRCGLQLTAMGLFKKCAFHPHIRHFYMGSPRASRSFSRSVFFGNLGFDLNARIKKTIRAKMERPDVACNVMASQLGFKTQRYMLEELLAECSHLSNFYPKFHCKLNYIENFWATVKRRTHDNCVYTFSGLCNAVPRALVDVSIVKIH